MEKKIVKFQIYWKKEYSYIIWKFRNWRFDYRKKNF